MIQVEFKMNDKLILSIIDKFSSGSIGKLDFDDGTTRLILRKQLTETADGGDNSAATGSISSAGGALGKALAENSVRLGISANVAANTADEVSASDDGEKITSPIVATFYSSPSPDAPPFVKPGAKVRAGQTLCILEAMKMMNHLEAEFDCEIIEAHAANGDLVEYDQALFTVKRL